MSQAWACIGLRIMDSCGPRRSCAGTSVTEARVTSTGLLNGTICWGASSNFVNCGAPRADRRWMVIKSANGSMVSQRKNPSMALVKPEIASDGSGTHARSGWPLLLSYVVHNPRFLAGVTLRAPAMPDLFVPIQRRSASGDNVREVEVWKNKSPGIDQGEAAAAWFSTYFKAPASPAEYRLVYQDEVCMSVCVHVLVTMRVNTCACVLVELHSLDEFEVGSPNWRVQYRFVRGWLPTADCHSRIA